MKTLTIKNLTIQVDATGKNGSPLEQAQNAIDLINQALQREEMSLGAQILSSAIDNSDVEIEDERVILSGNPTLGFDATIENNIGDLFHLRNVDEGGFIHIDIFNEAGEHLDEYASGFSVETPNSEDADEVEQYWLNVERVLEYIELNDLG